MQPDAQNHAPRVADVRDYPPARQAHREENLKTQTLIQSVFSFFV
jgi:hypothetical protein